jgi:hypothetical protein
MSFATYTMLESDWPVLGQQTPYIDAVFDSIKSTANGEAISNSWGYLSLGFFYIDTTLLEQHSTQRAVDPAHVGRLKASFTQIGANRAEHPGVVIALGEQWKNLKHNNPYMISTTCPHLSKLTLDGTPTGLITQVIRGGHWTAAIQRLAGERQKPEENYWLYHVLSPGMFLFDFDY